MNICYQIISIYFCLTILISCRLYTNKKQIVEKKLTIEKCRIDTNHSYSLYLPSHDITCNEMPLIIIIDPHGNGNFAIKKFIESAEKYNCVLVASNLIKNNYSQYITSINTLIKDTRIKHSIKGPTYICGFSGGARMAISYSETYPVDGVLACGALASIEQIKASRTIIYSIMGMSDFNFPEIAEFIINPTLVPENLFLEIAGDLHEWPNSSTLSRGLGLLMCNSSYKNPGCISKRNFLKLYGISTNANIDSLKESKEFLKAKLIYSNIIRLSDLPNQKKFQKSYDSINESIDLNNEIKYLKKSIQFEMKLRDAYYKAILLPDTNWWKKEIKVLDKKIMTETDIYSLSALKRTKAYLGILCYTFSKNLLQNNDLFSALQVLTIYKMVEPNNADMLYYSALYNLKTGNIQKSEVLLNKSIVAGFSDTLLIRQDFGTKMKKTN